MSINRTKLFNASCMSLVVTSMTFAIRAGTVEPLGKRFNLSDTELAQIVGIASLHSFKPKLRKSVFVDAQFILTAKI